MATQKIDQPNPVPAWINGKAYTDTSLSTFPVLSNASNKTLHSAVSADKSTALLAVSAAAKAFKTWRKTSLTERRAVLEKLSAIIASRTDQLSAAAKAETSSGDLFQSIDLQFAAATPKEISHGLVEATRGDVVPMPEAPNAFGMCLKEPVGTVLIIAPWNSVFGLATRALSVAIAVGCTVVWKQSEMCPLSHHLLLQCFEEAGLPPGVINTIQVSREDGPAVTEAIIAAPEIRKVDFIGSANVGRAIGGICAKYLKPTLMELGGKGPAIVLDDANLEQAANLCAQGALIHHGQICFSTERIIVLKSVAEAFTTALKTAVENYQLPDTAVSESIASHAYDILKDAASHGDKFLVGGPEAPVNGQLKPAIVLEPRDSRIVDEETFGPSASLYVVDSEEEAVELANRTAYGLTASVHTRSMECGLRMSAELEYGQVVINQMTVYACITASQGGVKGSGWGRQNGKFGYQEFQNVKFVSYFSDRDF